MSRILAIAAGSLAVALTAAPAGAYPFSHTVGAFICSYGPNDIDVGETLNFTFSGDVTIPATATYRVTTSTRSATLKLGRVFRPGDSYAGPNPFRMGAAQRRNACQVRATWSDVAGDHAVVLTRR